MERLTSKSVLFFFPPPFFSFLAFSEGIYESEEGNAGLLQRRQKYSERTQNTEDGK